MEMKEFYYENGLRVSVFNLDHKAVPYHFHNEVSDMLYCARGQITIELPDSCESFKVDPGQVFQVPSPTKHRFINSAPAGVNTRYVLVQIGNFDINFLPAVREIAATFAGRDALAVPDGVVHIEDRKNDLVALGGRFEKQKPETLTLEECDDVVRALRFMASHGIQKAHPSAAVRPARSS